MSAANYSTSVSEHAEILVGIKCASDIDSDSVQFVLNRLESHKTVIINDAGCSINVNFSLLASPENCAWGSFQAHRQVYGLIYLAEAANAMEAALVQDKFNKLKEDYGSGVYHSRCLIFGIDTAIRPSHSNIFQFSSYEAWKSIDYDIKQFIISIFYELESKRHKMLQERYSKVHLLLAPFESPEERNIETDSKMYRKKCAGRHYKHLADIHLLLGLVPEALQHYNSALDMLMSASDSSWVGCALEGLCVVSADILMNDATEYSSVSSKETAPSKFALDPRNLSVKPAVGLSQTDVKKLCIPSFKDLVDKYREAIIHYSRHKTLTVVELEACIKATKIFSKAKKYLEASEFIQNAVYITLNVSEQERLQRYSVMGDLYKGIGFKRKSFFYKRVAAMHCVSPQLKNPDWKTCNKLLMEAISTLSSNTDHFLENVKGGGWPSVIQRVWRELVYSLERVGEQVMSNWHLLYVFLAMFPYMNETDEKEIFAALENFSKSNKSVHLEPDQFPFTLNFYKLPIVKAMVPQIDGVGYRPIKSKLERSPHSVFIYTPASYKIKKQDHRKIKFDWCVNTPCRIDVEIYNPLSFCPIQVNEFCFIIDSTDNTVLDCPPFSFSITPQVTSKVQVSIVPLKPGTLKIVGYAFKIFGIQAKCYFDENKYIQNSEMTIDVISELPLLRCDFTGIQADYHENDIPEIIAYSGETRQLPFMLTNTGSSTVSSWQVSCQTKLSDAQGSLIYDDKFDGVELLAGTSIPMPVKVKPASGERLQNNTNLCTLLIKYAAKVDGDVWWRSLEVDMNFIFKPSVEVAKLTIEDSQPPSSPTCVVNATLSSRLDDTVDLYWEEFNNEEIVEKSAVVPPKCTYCCNIVMKKWSASDESAEHSEPGKFLLDHIKNKINFSWKMKSSRKKYHAGSVGYNCSLSKQEFSRMIDVLITCSSSLQDSPIVDGQDYVIPLSEVCHVSFEFFNTGLCKKSLKVVLEIFQDQFNGYQEWNLEECILCLGCTTSTIKVDPSESVRFPCDIVMMREGTYCVRAAFAISILDDYSSPSSNIQCYSPLFRLKSQF